MQGVARLLPIVLLLGFAYVLLFQLPRKRARQVSMLQAALSVGDQVMLTSGIYGRVEAMVEDKIDVEIAPGVVVTVHRGAVGEIVRDVSDGAMADGTLGGDDAEVDLSSGVEPTGSSALDGPDAAATSYGDPAGPDADPHRGAL